MALKIPPRALSLSLLLRVFWVFVGRGLAFLCFNGRVAGFLFVFVRRRHGFLVFVGRGFVSVGRNNHVVSDRALISTSFYRKNMQLQLWRPFVADVDLPIGVRTRIRTCASIMARRHEFADFLAYRDLPYNGVAVGIFLRLLVEAGATLATRECYRWSIMITRPQRMS